MFGVSTHTLTRRVTSAACPAAGCSSGFNPHPHAEGDAAALRCLMNPCRFNPHPHAEGDNVGAIFTSLVVAKNAKIRFLQGNELRIEKPDGTVTAGLSGRDTGSKIRFWAGSDDPEKELVL